MNRNGLRIAQYEKHWRLLVLPLPRLCSARHLVIDSRLNAYLSSLPATALNCLQHYENTMPIAGKSTSSAVVTTTKHHSPL
jgi:hypothetical protein